MNNEGEPIPEEAKQGAQAADQAAEQQPAAMGGEPSTGEPRIDPHRTARRDMLVLKLELQRRRQASARIKGASPTRRRA